MDSGNSWQSGGGTQSWDARREGRPFSPPEILPPLDADEPAHPSDWAYHSQPTAEPVKPRKHQLLRWSAAPATYLLVFANVLMFLLMLGSGAQSLSPGGTSTPRELMLWGAKSSATVLIDHEWWRLLTAMFIHAGILHLATNMWCLWNLGLLGEPMLGPLGMICVYTLSGAAGNLLGLAADALVSTVQGTALSQVPSVGASGAVFGIAGLLIIFLSKARLPIPAPEVARLRRSVIYFAALNFILGAGISLAPTEMKVDNMAHLGGFAMGLALGVPLAPKLAAGRTKYFRRQTVVFASSALILAAAAFGVASFWMGS
jgi:rhomboid protease GluP